MDYTYETEDNGCWIVTMEPIFSSVLSNSPTNINYSDKNLPHWVGTDSFKPDMDYLNKNSYFDDYGQWDIT